MAEVILKTNQPDKVPEVLNDAINAEKSRLKYSLKCSLERLKKFEQKYNISSETFINEWSAENLQGGDMEYVEWSGEYQFSLRLDERLAALESIEYVAS